jgi:hypothetical protein
MVDNLESFWTLVMNSQGLQPMEKITMVDNLESFWTLVMNSHGLQPSKKLRWLIIRNRFAL